MIISFRKIGVFLLFFGWWAASCAKGSVLFLGTRAHRFGWLMGDGLASILLWSRWVSEWSFRKKWAPKTKYQANCFFPTLQSPHRKVAWLFQGQGTRGRRTNHCLLIHRIFVFRIAPILSWTPLWRMSMPIQRAALRFLWGKDWKGLSYCSAPCLPPSSVRGRAVSKGDPSPGNGWRWGGCAALSVLFSVDGG